MSVAVETSTENPCPARALDRDAVSLVPPKRRIDFRMAQSAKR
jgi:hypothetical protein